MPHSASARQERDGTHATHPRNRLFSIFATIWATLAMAGANLKSWFHAGIKEGQARRQGFRTDTGGFIDVRASFAIVGVLVGALVGLTLLFALGPRVIRSGANFTSAVSTADFGDSTANSLRPVATLLLGLGLLFGMVGLALGYFFINRQNA